MTHTGLSWTAVANILTLPENDEVMVVGTVYKDMKLKPSILDEYVKVQLQQTDCLTCVASVSQKSNISSSINSVSSLYRTKLLSCSCLQDRGASQLVGRTKFVGSDDSIILEDESARMKLKGEDLPVGQLVTGVVMAVKGVAAPGGDFRVNVWNSQHQVCPHFALHLAALGT